MKFTETIKSVSEILRTGASAEFVFGSSQEVKGKTIIPVSSIKYGFGARGGKMGNSEENDNNNEGNGGGGGIMNDPLGVFEITEEKTCFKPVINSNHIFKLILCWMIISFLKKLFFRK